MRRGTEEAKKEKEIRKCKSLRKIEEIHLDKNLSTDFMRKKTIFYKRFSMSRSGIAVVVDMVAVVAIAVAALMLFVDIIMVLYLTVPRNCINSN